MADKADLSDIDSEGVYMLSIEEFQTRRKPRSSTTLQNGSFFDTPSADWGTRKPGHSPADAEKTAR